MLYDGKIIETATPTTLFNNPSQLRIKSFFHLLYRIKKYPSVALAIAKTFCQRWAIQLVCVLVSHLRKDLSFLTCSYERSQYGNHS